MIGSSKRLMGGARLSEMLVYAAASGGGKSVVQNVADWERDTITYNADYEGRSSKHHHARKQRALAKNNKRKNK